MDNLFLSISFLCRTPIKYIYVLCLYRVLVQICKTRAFQKLNPAQFDLHVEVTDAVVVSLFYIDITCYTAIKYFLHTSPK